MLAKNYKRLQRFFGPGLPDVRPVFLHMPKAAGMTIRKALAERYSDRWTVSVNVGDLPNLWKMPEWKFSRCAFYAGHFGMETVERVKNKKFVFTLLRDPVERVVSNYYFFKTLEAEPRSNGVVLAKKLTLLDYVRCDDPQVRYVTEDLQTRHLTDSERELFSLTIGPSKKAGERAVAAIAALENFDYVGLVEASAESMQIISQRLGIRLFGRYENVTPERLPISELSVAERDAIEQRVEADRILYKWVSENGRFHRAKSAGSHCRP